jgi:hypothetical protein
VRGGAEFDTRTPHCTAGARPGAVELLAAFSKQGKRIQMGAKPATGSPEKSVRAGVRMAR